MPLSPIMSWLGWVLGVFRGRGLQIWGPIVEIPTAFATFDGFQAKFSVLVDLWWGGSGHKRWCCGRPARAWWVFRLPLALGVPWGCWGCLGGSVLAQGAPQVLNPREMTRLISELPPCFRSKERALHPNERTGAWTFGKWQTQGGMRALYDDVA